MNNRPLLNSLLARCGADGRLSINAARDILAEYESPAVRWRPIAEAPQDGTRLMLWDSVSKRPVFGSWRGDNPEITHYAVEPTGPEVA